MKEDILNNYFIETIRKKIPERGKLTNKLADILFIEKEAVYRRLRGEVPFTLDEVTTISKEMNISIDNIIGNTSPNTYPFFMTTINFGNPSQVDYQMLDEYVNQITEDAQCPNSEFYSASSTLPIHFIAEFKYLFRFYILKWSYQFGSPGSTKPYAEIKLTEQLIRASKDFLIESQRINNTYLIWNEQMFYHLIKDIIYFSKIKLITIEEVELLKDDIIALLNKMEKLAASGTFPSGKRIQFYISRLTFAASYIFIGSCEKQRAHVKTYILNEVTSTDNEICQKMRKWLEALKRTSVLISESGSLERIKYFEQQRALVDTLSNIQY